MYVGGAVELYHNDIKAFETQSGGVNIYDSAATGILALSHSGADGQILNSVDEGHLLLKGTNDVSSVVSLAEMDPDKGVTLYWQGSKAFATVGAGVTIQDPNGDSPFLYLTDDIGDTRAMIYVSADKFYVRSVVDGGELHIQAPDTGGSNKDLIVGNADNSVDLYYAGVKKFETSEDGILLENGVAVTVNDISNDATAYLDTQLMTAEAIQDAILTSAGAYIHTQAVDSSSWIVNHNLGQQYVNIEVSDENDLAIIPDEIEFNNTNQLTITFLQDETGHAAVTNGGSGSGGGASIPDGTNNAVVRYDGTSEVQDSGVSIDDSDNVSGINDLAVDGDITVADKVEIVYNSTTESLDFNFVG